MTRPPVYLTEERSEKIRKLASNRQMDLAIVLENVHDPHNIGAVIRTCDAVGIPKIYMMVSDARVWDNIELGINASSGARKWVDVFIYDNYEKCFAKLRENYTQIMGTHLAADSISLYDMDITQPTAIVLGNEHEGITEKAREYLDGNFVIPQFGMVQSLNISVACAVSAYEALRQRREAGMYGNSDTSSEQEILHQDYRHRNQIQHKGDRGIIVPD